MDYQTIQKRLKKLPRRGIVAFTARCARRMRPLFDRAIAIPNFQKHLTAVDQAIELAESFANHIPAKTFLVHVTSRKYVQEAKQLFRAAYQAAGAAKYASRTSVEATDAANFYAASIAAAVAACAALAVNLSAYSNSDTAKVGARAGSRVEDVPISSDLHMLESLANSRTDVRLFRTKRTKRDSWCDAINSSEAGPLGPLWPNGPPEWFIDPLAIAPELAAFPERLIHSASKHQKSALTVYVDAGGADGETIRDLFLALSAVYEAQGGSGLKITKHRQRTLVGEEVPV